MSKRDHNTAKMAEAGFAVLTDLRSTYGLKAGNPGKAVLTLPRIALCFPIQSCQYALQRQNNPVAVNGAVEKVLSCQAVASLIPQDISGKMVLIKAAAYFGYQLSEVIGSDAYKSMSTVQKKKICATLDVVENVTNYVKEKTSRKHTRIH